MRLFDVFKKKKKEAQNISLQRPWLYGAVIGDVVGSTYEFNNIKQKEFPLFPVGSSYTDDTIMTIAIDAPAEIVNGRTMIPVRALSDGSYYKGQWKDGYYHGYGTMYDTDNGHTRTGQWRSTLSDNGITGGD